MIEGDSVKLPLISTPCTGVTNSVMAGIVITALGVSDCRVIVPLEDGNMNVLKTASAPLVIPSTVQAIYNPPGKLNVGSAVSVATSLLGPEASTGPAPAASLDCMLQLAKRHIDTFGKFST